MALALQNPEHMILSDDILAGHAARAAGLIVRGTLRVLVETKSHDLTEQIEPYVNRGKLPSMFRSLKMKALENGSFIVTG